MHRNVVRSLRILTKSTRRPRVSLNAVTTATSNRSFASISESPADMKDTSAMNSYYFRIQSTLEKLRFRDEWSTGMLLKIVNRVERPRFGFPGVYDRAPPPPKTLHWRHAPAEGEYHKIRSLLTWASLHIWLIQSRIGPGHPYAFLVDHSFEFLYNELTSKWLPEASIPSFSIKSEAKRLVDESRSFVADLSLAGSDQAFIDAVWAHGCRDRGISIDDPVIPDLMDYVRRQKNMLASTDLRVIVQEPSSWSWDDSLS